MRDLWVATFVAHLTMRSLLSLDEAIEVAARVYAQASRLSPEAAADYVLQSGLVRRLDQLRPPSPQAMDPAETPDARGTERSAARRQDAASDPAEHHRRRGDAPGVR